MIYRSSQIKTAKQCIAKSHYKYNLGLSPKRDGGVNPDLHFGKAVHKAIEIYFKENYENAVAYLDSLAWPVRTAKTRNVAKMLLNIFRLNFKETLIFSEQYFKIAIDKEMTLLGRYDIVSKDKFSTSVSDIKTTMPSYLLTKPDDQFISYYIAGREEFPGMDKVVVYNLDPNQVEMSIKLISYSEAEIKEWIKETKSFLAFYQKCMSEEVYPKTPGACLDFNRLCEYHQLCTSSGSVRQMLIENAFVVNEETKNLRW